jgi:hypothetical protein
MGAPAGNYMEARFSMWKVIFWRRGLLFLLGRWLFIGKFLRVSFSPSHFLLVAQKKVTKEKGPLPQLLRRRSEASAQQSFPVCFTHLLREQSFSFSSFLTTGSALFKLF